MRVSVAAPIPIYSKRTYATSRSTPENSVDDTAALAALLTALPDGSNVIFDRYHTITDAITITASNITISAGYPGAGFTQTGAIKSGLIVTGINVLIDGLKMAGNASGNASVMPSSYGAAVSAWRTTDVTVKKCTISGWGGQAAGSTGTGIYFSGSSNCLAENNVVDDCLNGINDDDYGASEENMFYSVGNVIEKNIVQNSRATGISIDHQQSDSTPHISYGTRVVNNTVFGTLSWQASYGNGIVFDTVREGVIKGNVCYGNAASGILLFHKTIACDVFWNVSRDNGVSGLAISSDSSSVPGSNSVMGNTFSQNDGNGIRITGGSNDIKIIGNTIRLNQWSGIYSDQYLRESTIAKNNITLNRWHGIHLNNSFSIIVDGNTIAQNGNDGVGNNYDGICVGTGGTYEYNYYGIRVVHNIFDATAQGTEWQRYAVNFVSNAGSNRCAIVGNVFKGQLTGDYIDGSTATEIAHNSQLKAVGTAAVETHGYFTFQNGQIVCGGAGSPEGAVVGPRGSMWLRSDGGAGTTFYIKESGTGNTGWVAK